MALLEQSRKLDVPLGHGRSIAAAIIENPSQREGFTLVALHGFLDNMCSFAPIVEHLCAETPVSQIVLMDLPGHGHSSHSTSGNYALTDAAFDVLSAIHALRLEDPVLLGHSLGGNVAMIVASSLPCRGLVILDNPLGPILRGLAPDTEAARVFARHVQEALRPDGERQPLRVFATEEEAAATRSEKNIGGKLDLPLARLLNERALAPSEDGRGFVWRSDRKLLLPSRSRLSEGAVLSFVRAVRSPTLVVLSRQGMIGPLLRLGPRAGPLAPLGIFAGWTMLTIAAVLGAVDSVAGAIGAGRPFGRTVAFLTAGHALGLRVRSLRDGQVRQLPAGGHHFHMERPADTAKAIGRWMQQRLRP